MSDQNLTRRPETAVERQEAVDAAEVRIEEGMARRAFYELFQDPTVRARLKRVLVKGKNEEVIALIKALVPAVLLPNAREAGGGSKAPVIEFNFPRAEPAAKDVTPPKKVQA